MTDNFPSCVAFTLSHEGGFSNDPRDPGGATNLGITAGTLAHWRGTPVTAADVRALGQTEAAAIYRASYWNACHCGELPLGIDLMIFDFGVNAGPGTSVRELQEAVGVTQDGMVGPDTEGAARRVADEAAYDLINVLREAHETHYRSLRGFPVFGRGWLRRLGECSVIAQSMADADTGGAPLSA